MGEAFISRRGGKAAAYAVIGVTFPSGSTVTCVRNGVSLRANGSGTSVYFNVPDAGVWVVTIVDGSKTKSQTVTISTAGQVEKLTMTYELSLISNGVIQSPASWTAEDVTIQNGSGYVDLVMSHADYDSGMYVRQVDLTEYTTLTVEANNAGSTVLQPNYKWLKAAIKQTADASNPQTTGEYVSIETSASKQTFTLDVSGKTGTWYVGFFGHGIDVTSDPSQPAYLEAIARVYNMSLS